MISGKVHRYMALMQSTFVLFKKKSNH